MTNCYKTLGVEDFSSNDEIKAAYRKLSKKFHPDVNDGDVFFEELFKGIQNAYEILCDDKRKAIHDNSLKPKASTHHYQTEQSVNDKPKTSTHHYQAEQSVNDKPIANNPAFYFTIGSTKDHVLELQGTPTAINKYEPLNKEVWKYGLNSITFNHGLVQEYSNFNNLLKVQLYTTFQSDVNYFTLGSSKEHVLRLQGTPTAINKYEPLNKEVWKYGLNSITFEFNRVSEYNNFNRILKVKL
ncbi:J domain-containing protein [Spirosoma pulveris]